MPAYYNEFDPYAAQWLRNLIAAGHIAPGEVDERSIRDVSPDDLRGFTQCHFFAGIGIWSYAARRAGWPDDRQLWTGSCPCQPFSAAGKRKGIEDDRHLWPEYFRLVAKCGPDTVLGEQVASKDGLAWLEGVQADLERAGYAVGAVDTCAAGFADEAGNEGFHIRQRLYWGARRLADTNDASKHALLRQGQNDSAQDVRRSAALRLERQVAGRDQGELERLVHPVGTRLEGQPRHGDGGSEPGRLGTQQDGPTAAPSGACRLADAHGDGAQRQRGDNGEATGLPAEERADQRADVLERSGAVSRLGHAESERRVGRAHDGDSGRRERTPGQAGADGGLAHTLPAGRPQGRPESGRGPAAGSGSVDWLPCRDGKLRPVESGTFPLAHADPARVGRLRAYGNALDAAQAQGFVEAWLDCDPG